MTVESSTISGNVVNGVPNQLGLNGPVGGGIFNSQGGSATLDHSTITSNSVPGGFPLEWRRPFQYRLRLKNRTQEHDPRGEQSHC